MHLDSVPSMRPKGGSYLGVVGGDRGVEPETDGRRGGFFPE